MSAAGVPPADRHGAHGVPERGASGPGTRRARRRRSRPDVRGRCGAPVGFCPARLVRRPIQDRLWGRSGRDAARWPTAIALTELTADDEARIGALATKAAS